MITPLPPPSGSPATAALNVMARESRSTSRMASVESAYVHIRQPPSAGPRVVEWTATMVNRPDRRPRRTSSVSWARGSGYSMAPSLAAPQPAGGAGSSVGGGAVAAPVPAPESAGALLSAAGAGVACGAPANGAARAGAGAPPRGAGAPAAGGLG